MIETEKDRAEQQVEVQHDVTRILSEGDEVETTIPQVLESFCRHLEWDFGSLWLIDSDESFLRCVGTWSRPGLDLEAFKNETTNMSFVKGIGLPGRVWKTGRTTGILDVTKDLNFPRFAMAAKGDLHAATGFPVLIDGQVSGVMEFLSRARKSESDIFHDTVEAIATQVGQFIKRTRAEEMVREGEDRYRAVAESAAYGILTMTQDSIVTSINPAGEKIFGYSKVELLGKPITALMPERFRSAHRHGLARFLQTGKKSLNWEGTELPGLHKSGRELPLRISFGVSVKRGRHYFTGIFRDITEEKEANKQRERRVSYTNLRADVSTYLAQPGLSVREVLQPCADAIIRYLPVALVRIWTLDVETSVLVLQASAGMYTHLTGAQSRVPMGKYQVGIIARDGKPHLTNDWQNDPGIDDPAWARDEKMIGFAGYPLKTESPVFGVLAMFSREQLPEDTWDVMSYISELMAQGIERRRAEDEICRLNRDLEQKLKQLQEVNEQLEAFTYTVAHDLRAPLRAMKNFAQIIEEDEAQKFDEEGRRYFSMIVDSANQMDAWIEDLLKYSAVTRAELVPERVQVEAVVNKVIVLLARVIEDKKADVTIENELPTVTGHGATLEHVFANLISNALKFVAPGVVPRVVIKSEERGKMIRFWIIDNGIGISPEHVDKVFRMFERLHTMADYPGTGIGLAIVRKGVERMNGTVGVESEVGHGSRFWLELPPA